VFCLSSASWYSSHNRLSIVRKRQGLTPAHHAPNLPTRSLVLSPRRRLRLKPLASRLLDRYPALNVFSNSGSRPAAFRQRVLVACPFPATTSHVSPASVSRSLTIRRTCRPPATRDSPCRVWCLAGSGIRASRSMARRRGATHASSSTSASSMSLLVMTSPRHRRFRRLSAAVVGSSKS
jgi:hypothetical protein